MSHDNPTRCAFCVLFFANCGGQFLPDGTPLIGGTIDENGEPDALAARSLCPHPFDCASCPLLQEWVEAKMKEGWVPSWECFVCLGEANKKEDPRVLPGYYQSGRAGIPKEDPEHDPDKTAVLQGCMRCGNKHSTIQLVMRKPGNR